MGMFDLLKSGLGQLEAGAGPALLSQVLSKTNLGDLQGLVAKLQQGGLDQQVKSWLGNGQNMPITADQLRNALENDQVKQLAQRLGVDPNAALSWLSQHLPNIVDQASPNGTLQSSK